MPVEPGRGKTRYFYLTSPRRYKLCWVLWEGPDVVLYRIRVYKQISLQELKLISQKLSHSHSSPALNPMFEMAGTVDRGDTRCSVGLSVSEGPGGQERSELSCAGGLNIYTFSPLIGLNSLELLPPSEGRGGRGWSDCSWRVGMARTCQAPESEITQLGNTN